MLKTGANHSRSTLKTLIFSLSGLCFKNASNFETPSWDKKWVNTGKNQHKYMMEGLEARRNHEFLGV